jgi:hypothetical protein
MEYVTRDEFRATIGPIQSDVTEIKADVKAMRSASESTRWLGIRGQDFIANILPLVCVGLLGAGATLAALLIH